MNNILTSRMLDKFYTSDEAVRLCTSFLSENTAGKPKPVLCVEPSAGAGAFLPFLPRPFLAMDIAPEGPRILKQDFLSWRPERVAGPIWVIGNPPFGKNASLAMRFLNHAASFSDVVAFILPRTFEKPRFASRVSPDLHLAGQIILPEMCFTLDGSPLNVPSVFQVWERRESKREIIKHSFSHPHFSFVPIEQGDFIVQRVGVRAGTVKDASATVSASSHVGVRATVLINPATLRTRFEALDYDRVKHRTAGNPSVGKGEMVELYEAAFPT